jgi:hypothetical protein
VLACVSYVRGSAAPRLLRDHLSQLALVLVFNLSILLLLSPAILEFLVHRLHEALAPRHVVAVRPLVLHQRVLPRVNSLLATAKARRIEAYGLALVVYHLTDSLEARLPAASVGAASKTAEKSLSAHASLEWACAVLAAESPTSPPSVSLFCARRSDSAVRRLLTILCRCAALSLVPTPVPIE